jgi:6-pyruvoyl-tetrahydropterin synthase
LKEVIEELDHHYLNDIVIVPTAERITEYLLSKLSNGIDTFVVRVYESPDSYAEETE